MKIVIDGKSDLVFAEEGSKFGEILEQLREWLETHRLVITELALDGEFLNTERREELHGVSVDAFGELDVTTIDPVALSRKTLLEVKGHLPPLSTSLVEITEKIQTGELQTAWMKLTMSFEVWSVIIEAVDKVARLARVDVAAFQVRGTPLTEKMDELKGLLDKAKKAMENQDIVTVGDLMEYEFAPRIEDWDSIIDALYHQIDPSPPS